MDVRKKRIRKCPGHDNQLQTNEISNEVDETDQGTGAENDVSSAEIKKEIEALREGDPKVAEGKIRAIIEKISALPADDKSRKKLERRLKEAAERGLDEDLKKLLGENGLTLDMGLILVSNHLTDKLSLAQFLYETPNEKLSEKLSQKLSQKLSENELEVISRKLRPELEVLGGLKAKGIDTSKDSVKKLIEKAPSFSKLSRLNSLDEVKCEESEKEEIENLMAIAKSKERDKRLTEKNAKKKKEQEKKLEKAKAYMKDAEEMASKAMSANKEKLNEKIQEISKMLELPPDWYKQDKMTAERTLAHLNEEISKFAEYIETRPRYNSLEEVVAKASGGRALTGLLYSEYAPPVTAGLPILDPPSKVESLNTDIPFESKYLKFTSEEAAADFVKTVESTGLNIAVATVGFYGPVVFKGEGAYGSHESDESTHHSTSSGTSAAVTHHFRIGTQAFQIRREEITLRKEARKKALLITKEKDTEKQKDAARHFFSQYGSHIPCGVHSLGGIFFTIANARSSEKTDVATLTHQAVTHLHVKVSIGWIGEGFGGGASGTFDREGASGKTTAHQEENENVSYTYSLKSIGPNADSPATFKKLLSNNNSTWAILERGPKSAYVPVWELFQELDEEYKKPASVMKQTWNEDERKKSIEQKRNEEYLEKVIGVGSVISLRTKISKKILTMKKSKEEGVDIEYANESKVWARWTNNVYYPGKIERVDDKIHVKFDDGDEDNYDLRDITAVIPDLKPGKVNESKIWGRWTNGLYYPGKVKSIDADIIHVQFDDKDKANYELSDIAAVIPDLKPDPEAVKKGTEVIGENKDKGRYYPGKVTEIKGQKYTVQFQNGDKGELTLETMRLIPNGSSLFRVVKFVGDKMILKSHAFPGYFICVENGKLRAVKKNKIDPTCHFKVDIDTSTYEMHTFPAYSKDLVGAHQNDTPFEFHQIYK